jgi:hypothetical protein
MGGFMSKDKEKEEVVLEEKTDNVVLEEKDDVVLEEEKDDVVLEEDHPVLNEDIDERIIECECEIGEECDKYCEK